MRIHKRLHRPMKINYLLIAAILVFSLFCRIGLTYKEPKPGNTKEPAPNVQRIDLTMEGWKYVFTPKTAKSGTPVLITANLTTVTGCMRDFMIPQLGIRKVFKSGDNTLIFTPQQHGPLKVQCSMSMGKGTLIIE